MFWRNSKFSKTFSSIWDHSTIFDPKLVHIFPPHRITRLPEQGDAYEEPSWRLRKTWKTCGRHGPKPWPDIQPEMDAAWFKHDAIMLHLSAMDFLWTLQGPSLSKSSFILHLMFVFIAKSVSSSHLKPSSMFSKVPSYRNLALRFYAAFA